jgi:hypothetical protein
MDRRDLKTLAHLRRVDGLADLREGRKRRAVVIPSGKIYRRKTKHQLENE